MSRHHQTINICTGEIAIVPFTVDEETARDIEEVASLEQVAIQNAITASYVAARERAVAKLVALGLTDEEVEAFRG